MKRDDELRPMFGPLARRLDPLLAAEDTNPLYDAFRRRRKLHGGSGASAMLSWRTLRLRTSAGQTILWSAVAVAYVLSVIFGRGSAFPLLMIAWGAIVVIRALVRRGDGSGKDVVRLPSRLAPMFLASMGRGTRGESDIWMTGASGATVAEALYLEMREYMLVVTAVVVQLVADAGMVFYWRLAGEFRFGGLFLSIALPWFAWRISLLFFAAGSATAWNRIGAIASRWHATALPPTIRGGIARIAGTFEAMRAAMSHRGARRIVLLAVGRFFRKVGGPCALIAVAIATVVLAGRHADSIGAALAPTKFFLFLGNVFDAFAGALRFVGWETLVATLLLAASFKAGKSQLKEAEGAEKARTSAMRNFERSYQLYMAKVIQQDPDAVAWADLALPEDRSRRLSERLRALIAKADAETVPPPATQGS